MQKVTLVLAFVIIPSVCAQDLREYNHGTCLIEYQDSTGIHYYLTWSSAYNNAWEHDIYSSVVSFNELGDLIIDSPDQLYIGTGTDEAQEPVHAAINKSNNGILSVWEDGSDPDHPNVRGQLHETDGSIIRENWIIAGGEGSQHSANAAHLGDKYLVFYADEAPPATNGAMVKCKVLDDVTGLETQTITFTPDDEDHWWPVSVSNESNTRTLIIWGNDGYASMGTVLYENEGVIYQTAAPQDYLINVQQYYYQVIWLENISNFLLVSRNGAYDAISDESKIALIDTSGASIQTVIVNGGIAREAQIASKWSEEQQAYFAYYPSGDNNLTQIIIDGSGTIAAESNQVADNPDLTDILWPSTGIWSQFINSTTGHDLFNDQYIGLFIMNDDLSNDIIHVPVHFDNFSPGTAIIKQDFRVVNQPAMSIQSYPNPFNPETNILYSISKPSDVAVKVMDITGRTIQEYKFSNKQAGNHSIEWSGNDMSGIVVPAGLYFAQVHAGYQVKTIKLIYNN